MRDLIPAFFGFLIVAFVVLVLATHPRFIKTGVGSIGTFTEDVLGAASQHRGA